MSLTIDAIRREIQERRQALAELHRAEAACQAQAEQLDARLQEVKQQLADTQSTITQEDQAIELLQGLAAVLAERLPVAATPRSTAEPELDPAVQAREEAAERARRQREEELATARKLPRLDAPRVKRHSRDPLVVADRATSVRGPDRRPRESRTTVQERAAELDLGEVSETFLQRAEIVAMVLVDYGPLTHAQISEHVAQVLECGEATARSTVARCLPILYKRGRIQGDGSRECAWSATPQERASGRMGTDLENFEGTTTRWPKPSQQPAPGSRIRVESGPFETKR